MILYRLSYKYSKISLMWNFFILYVAFKALIFDEDQHYPSEHEVAQDEESYISTKIEF